MAHVSNVKKLLSEDLKGLITQITKFEEGSPEFKQCEDTAWSIIFDKYYPSVNEHRVKSTLYEFVDKFKVHGFPQKAQNLSLLIDMYSKLPYFKEYCGTEVQWGLIDFIIKLSFKPTNSLEDDPPLDLSKKNVKKEESFDWGAYLKEGLEKFRLPSEDEKSLSDWSDDEEISDKQEEISLIKLEDVQHATFFRKKMLVPPPPTASDLKLEAEQRIEEARAWLENNTQGMWWKNETFREIPKSEFPEANYCFEWEKRMKCSPDTRILSEYKVLRELCYVLARPTDCFFLEEVSPNNFEVVPKTSISSLSPSVFKVVIEENFCKYLSHIKRLQSFCSEMNFAEVPSCVPATYRAYGAALEKILKKYYDTLLEFEKKVAAQDSITTLFHLLNQIAPFLNQIDFLSKLHMDAVPSNWKERDMRTNAFSLLCTLYDELQHPKKWVYGDTAWPIRALLILFMESFYPFLKFLAQYMTGYPHHLLYDEFFLSSSGDILLDFKNLDSTDFWEPVLNTASLAITSCSFLMKLEKQTSFFLSNYPSDILFVEVVKKVSELLLYETLDIDTEFNGSETNLNKNEYPNVFDGSLWDRVFKEVIAPPRMNLFTPTACDKFSEKLSEIDLTSYATTIVVKNAVKSVIEEYMEPKGFAAEILLDQLKLLDHLNALYSSLQVTTVFSTVLITEFNKVDNWKKIMWFSKFESCLSDLLPQEYVANLRLSIDKRSYVDEVTIFDLPDCIKLSYEADNTVMTLIPEDTLMGYAQIFRFLLKTRIALAALNRLVVIRIAESENNSLRFRRLYSLRLWLLHIMNTINFYFSTYSQKQFQQKVKTLCLNERNLSPIVRAHREFVENWKHHCFVSVAHPCMENVLELIALCAKLNLYFEMEHKNQLGDFHLDDFEKAYMDCIRNFASNLQLFDERLQDGNDTFSFLYDEVANNIPAQTY